MTLIYLSHTNTHPHAPPTTHTQHTHTNPFETTTSCNLVKDFKKNPYCLKRGEGEKFNDFAKSFDPCQPLQPADMNQNCLPPLNFGMPNDHFNS